MITEILLSIFIGGVFSLLTLPSILHLQISEYLLYRYKDFILSKGIVKALVVPRFAFPAKSIRNILIFAINILLLSIYTYVVIFPVGQIWLILLTPLLLRLSSILGVLLTAPLSWIFRYRYIYLAQRQLKNSHVQVIGITGSYGKSSVKEYLHQILSTKYITGKTRGNRNTEVGIAIEMALQIKPYTQYFVAEMGAYRKGDIAKLCKRFRPTIGVVTAVGNQHLSLFGSRENIIKTKLEMLTNVSNKGYVSLDWDGAVDTTKQLKTSLPIHTYSTVNGAAEYMPSNVVTTDGVTEFVLNIKGSPEVYKTQLLGNHSLLNLIPAIVIARELGVSYQLVRDCVISIKPILGKLSVHQFDKYVVINDGYNSNVDGFITAIDVLHKSFKGDKVVSSLGIFELGSDKEDSYRRVIDKLKDTGIQMITTDGLFKTLGEDCVTLVDSEYDILEYINTFTTIPYVLVEGRHSPFFTKSLGIIKAY